MVKGDPRVLITDRIQDAFIERRHLGARLSVSPCDYVADVEVLLVWHADVDEETVNRFPRLKAVIRYGVGYDRIDVDCMANRGIVVCNNPDYCTAEVSDTTVAMALGIARGLFLYDAACRQYKDTWQENANPCLRRIEQQTLGVIGAGRIGSRVLSKAQAIGFHTIYYDKYLNHESKNGIAGDRTGSLPDLLIRSDIVTLHVPLTTETKDMVNQCFIDMMKPGASLINTARGGLIKDLDLIYSAIRSGHIYSVALDTLPSEPPNNGTLINAWRSRESWLDGRLLITPHVAFHSSHSIIEMREQAARNARRVLEGRMPHHVVNGVMCLREDSAATVAAPL